MKTMLALALVLGWNARGVWERELEYRRDRLALESAFRGLRFATQAFREAPDAD